MRADLFDRPALLFLPASRASAVAKARQGAADLVVLDLEDAVRREDKGAAREAAVAAVEESWPCPVAIRVNGIGTPWHEDDVGALRNAMCDLVVLPQATRGEAVAELAEQTGKPVLAMVESPAGVIAAPDIAGRAAGLIAGTNDLRAAIGIPTEGGRAPISAALQWTVLAARAAGIPAWDGVFNRLDDAAGFEAEAAEGRALGFDGKSLIHPDQTDACHRAFAPREAELERARRLVAAATGGAQSFEGAMIEDLHVAAARRLIERAR